MDQDTTKDARVDAERVNIRRTTLRRVVLAAFEWQARKCESPIERTLLAALLDHAGFGLGLGDEQAACARADGTQCYPQFVVAVEGRSYRLDFALVGDDFRIAVEADGHDYHERTKEQAARDRARDRAMQRDGWSVLRFTGSEIYADACACAHEIGAEIGRLSKKGAPQLRSAPPDPPSLSQEERDARTAAILASFGPRPVF